MLRALVIACGVVFAVPALAGEMSAEEARHFVIGKLFSYNCFEGTRGAGRVFADGSIVGTVQFQGSGPVRRAFLPAGTLKVKGAAVCASLRGMPMEPCFNLDRIDNNSFRGAVSGLGFAYCDFTRHHGRINVASEQSSPPRHHTRPISLRPTLANSSD